MTAEEHRAETLAEILEDRLGKASSVIAVEDTVIIDLPVEYGGETIEIHWRVADWLNQELISSRLSAEDELIDFARS